MLVNGDPADSVPGLDRGLLYGDGLFETVAVSNAQPRFWLRHMQRLRAGCRRLGIACPDAARLLAEAGRLIAGTETCLLKIIVTRGSGGQGYRAPAGVCPTRILQVLPWAGPGAGGADPGVAVRLCGQRLASNPVLAGIKHLNRLEQVLARREWEDPAVYEGLLRDASGNVIEGTMSNLFVLRGATLVTPDLSQCGVAGIMRSVVMELAAGLGLETVVREMQPEEVVAGDELFLTNSLIGIRPVASLERTAFGPASLTPQLQARLATLEAEGEAWYP